MIKNEYGRLEMFPLPDPGKGKLFIIGEYPNVDELRQGQYFISSGADALFRTLERFDINPVDCCYSNAVPYLMNKKNKTIPAERYQKERNRLIAEIIASGAEIVMPLGTLATSLLMNSKSMTITKVLGNSLSLPELHNVQIIPNYHPALLLHSPGNYKVFQSVIDTVKQAYMGRPRDPGITKWKWLTSREEIEAFIVEVSKLKYVAADIETSGLDRKTVDVWTFGIATTKNVVSVIDHEHILLYPDLIRKLFKAGCKWIWHHGKYDTSVWWWKGFTEAWLDEDTIYMHYCINETNGTHGLGSCATIYLGADEYKSKMNSQFKVLDNFEAYLQNKQELGERVAADADYTLQLYEVFEPQITADPNMRKLYDRILIPAANFLRKVEMRGLKVDVPYLESRVPYYEDRIQSITEGVQEAAEPFWDLNSYKDKTGAKSGGEAFKPTSVKQLAWLIYDKLKLKPAHKDAKKRGTGAEVLATIINPPEFIMKILELRKVVKEYKTYVVSYLDCKDENDLIHPSFNIHITQTGRLSCTEPNVQNVPGGKSPIRNAFIPRGPGRILMEVDYSGAELRVLAHVSGDANLRRALVEGDPHGELAEKIYGEAYTLADATTMKDLRGRAKTVNFGVAYGRGAADLAATFGISKAEAQNWIDTWALLYPDAWAYLQSCETAVREGQTLVTLYGRYRRLGLIHQGNINDLINEAKNFRIQSISSDNTLLAAMKADKDLEEKYDALIINLIHDSILIDLPGDPVTVKAVAEYMAGVMIQIPIEEFDCTVPFASDVDLGPTWGTFGAYDRTTEMVEYKKEQFTYPTWIQSKGVII